MVGLRWSDIDFEAKVLHVNQTMEYRYKVGEWRVGPPKSQSGYKPKTLQTILGHSNISVTMNRYVHTTEEEKCKEMVRISEALKVV